MYFESRTMGSPYTVELWAALLGSLALVLLCGYVWDHFSFWKKRGVMYLKPSSSLLYFGFSIKEKKCEAELSEKIYQKFKGERFCGIWRFLSPCMLVMDPELIRHIMVKDFQTWSDRGFPGNQAVDPLSANLVNLEGNEWRWVRVHVSPAFTPSKLKVLYTRLLECGNDFEAYLEDLTAAGGVIEAWDACSRFITNAVGSCAFGMKLDSFDKEDDAFYRTIRDEWMEPTFGKTFSYFMQLCFPRWFKILQISTVTKDFTESFMKVMKHHCEIRNENSMQRNDYMEILMKMINTDLPLGEHDMQFDEKLVAAQAFENFSGGLEASPMTISYCLHELAVNVDIQDRLREEVHATKAANDGQITWEAVNRMEYIDMVVKETLRKYPPVGVVSRTSIEPYRIPGTDVDLPPGLKCDIPVYAIHHDPAYYPDPKKFDPERFTPEAKSQRPAFTYLPFGAGPRSCIGIRVADYQVKVGIFKVVDKFKISLCEKSSNPLQFDASSRILTPTSGTWIKLSRN